MTHQSIVLNDSYFDKYCVCIFSAFLVSVSFAFHNNIENDDVILFFLLRPVPNKHVPSRPVEHDLWDISAAPQCFIFNGLL